MRDTLDMPPGMPPVGLDAMARRILSGWMVLAVGSLAVAGALALLLALARTPGAQDWLPWPWESFFRKALVTHVVFSFVVWYLAMLGALSAAARPGGVTSLVGLAISAVGAVLLLLPVLGNRGEPALVNYVPVLVDPFFYGGLAVLAAGVTLPVVHLLLRPPVWGKALAMGVGSAGILYLLALLCFFLAWHGLPADAALGAYDEQMFWGGGHMLQFVNTILLLTAWQILGELSFGHPPLPFSSWRLLCGLMVLAGLPGPILYAFFPTTAPELRTAFTHLYWIGLPLPVLIAALALGRDIWRGPRPWKSPAFISLFLSLVAFSLGGLLGLFADGGDTRTPAHYHAEIGGVNLAFMGLWFTVLLPALLRGGSVGRAVRAQFWLYGCGQMLFSLGMFIAGTAGVGRKIAGAAQGLDSVVKNAGMAMTGAGGVIAVIGGVMFVFLALRRLLDRSMG